MSISIVNIKEFEEVNNTLRARRLSSELSDSMCSAT
jgi:hypothetical protein